MAIALTSDQTVNTGTGRSSASFSHVFVDDDTTDLIILVCTKSRGNPGRTSTAVTYGGAAMTAVTNGAWSYEYTTGIWFFIKWWWIAAPTPGSTYTVAVTYAGTTNSDEVFVTAVHGVNTSSPTGATNNATGSGATPSVGLLTTVANSLILGGSMMRRASGGSYTQGGSAVELAEGETGTAANSDFTYTEFGATPTTVTTYTMSMTNATSSAQWMIAAIELIPAGGSPQTVTLNTLSGAAAAVALAVTPGAVAIALNTLSRALSAVSLAVAPGAVTIGVNTLTGALSAVSLAVAPGGVTITLSTVTAAGEVIDLTLTPGAAAVLLNTLAAALEAVDLAVTPGAVSVALNTLIGALAAVVLAVGEDAATIALSTLSASGSVVSLTVVPGAADVILSALSAALGAESLTVVPGGVTLVLNTFTLLSQLMELVVSQGIGLSTLSAAMTVESLTVVPGEAAVLLASLVHGLTAVNLEVLPGPVTIDLATLTAILEAVTAAISTAGADVTVLLEAITGALTPVEIGVIPGEMVIALQTLTPALTLERLLIFMLLGCVALGDRANYRATAADFRRYLVAVDDRGGCCE